jgi:hypothetical protein
VQPLTINHYLWLLSGTGFGGVFSRFAVSTSTLFHAVFPLEAFDASGGIYQALLPGVEGMAIRT